MPKIRIPTPLRPYADGEITIHLPGSTVSELLESVTLRHPELKKHLFADDGQLWPFVNLFLREKNVNALQGLDTPLSEEDTVLIIPSIAGG